MKDGMIGGVMVNLVKLLAVTLVIRFGLTLGLAEEVGVWIKLGVIGVIILLGAFYVLRKAADIVEETTGVLAKKTGLAGGLLQSLGTAFPDMALGVVAALTSLRLSQSDYAGAVNYAIIAAATTFGSNIYNIAHAAWCVWRQNVADRLEEKVVMFPWLGVGGWVRPMAKHRTKPSLPEIDTAFDVLNALTILTAVVAVAMVVFGKISNPPADISGDLYQLIRPVGVGVFLLAVGCLYYFRKTRRPEGTDGVASESRLYGKAPMWLVWLALGVSAVAILWSAESMVEAIKVLGDISHVPVVVVGVLAGIIGCLGEMLVVHNYSVHPHGRIADALVGVAMDNIVTTMGAAIVAMMGGIFLGGNALIIIFVLVLALNGVLMWQISKLKTTLVKFMVVEK